MSAASDIRPSNALLSSPLSSTYWQSVSEELVSIGEMHGVPLRHCIAVPIRIADFFMFLQSQSAQVEQLTSLSCYRPYDFAAPLVTLEDRQVDRQDGRLFGGDGSCQLGSRMCSGRRYKRGNSKNKSDVRFNHTKIFRARGIPEYADSHARSNRPQFAGNSANLQRRILSLAVVQIDRFDFEGNARFIPVPLETG